jgi:hypothetical protein
MDDPVVVAWRALFRSGVVARVWECPEYSTDTITGLLQCAESESEGHHAAASLLRWDVPITTWGSTEMIPTEAELTPQRIGRFESFWPRGNASRPHQMKIGSLFFDVPSHRRGFAYAHDAWRVVKADSEERMCDPARTSTYIWQKLQSQERGGGPPRMWHCAHLDWDAMLRDYGAWSLFVAARDRPTAEIQGHNQIHLSWNATQVSALFYLNESWRWHDAEPALLAAALDSAQRAHDKLRYVLWRAAQPALLACSSACSSSAPCTRSPACSSSHGRLMQLSGLPILQMRIDRQYRSLLERFSIVAQQSPQPSTPLPDMVALRDHQRTFQSAARTSMPPKHFERPKLWLGDTDAIGPKRRCHVTIYQARFVRRGVQLGQSNASCWPLPEPGTSVDAWPREPWRIDDIYTSKPLVRSGPSGSSARKSTRHGRETANGRA